MLTMTNALTIQGATVYQDDANQLATFEQDIADRPSWTIKDDGTVAPVAGQGMPIDTTTTPRPTYYLLPETPRIALAPDGSPLFSLIVYRFDEHQVVNPTQDVGGGILTFTVELASDKFDAIKAALNQQAGGGTGNDLIDLSYVQFVEGSISVSVAGETGAPGASPAGSQFVTTVIGNGTLGGVGTNKRAVMVKLTQDGASLLSQLDKLKTLPINIQYSLKFEHRLLGVKMIAFCDIRSSYTLIQTLRTQDSSYSDGYLNLSTSHQDDRIVQKVTEALVNSKNMYVTVIPESSQVSQDTLTALENEGSDILNKEVANVLLAGPPPAGLDRNQLESFVQTHNDSLNYVIDRRMVLEQTFTPSSNLQNLLAGANLDTLVAYVDLRTSFFSYLQVPIRVNADFDNLPISSVVVTVTYNRKAFDGSGIQQVRDSFNFTSGTQLEKFLAYANTLAEVSYDWDAEVHYKDSAAVYTMSQTNVKDNFLVVDVGQLGMVSTEFSLGLVDMTVYPVAVVSTRYQSAALGHEVGTQLRLDKNTSSAPWTAVIQEEPVNGFEYKVDWLHQPDRSKPPEIQTGTWITSHDSLIQLDAPHGQQMTVTVFCSGNFVDGPDKLSQVAVALHYEDKANNDIVDGQVTFTDDKQAIPWTVDLIDPSQRQYTYQYSNIYAGGVVKRYPEDGSWAPGDPGYITVGEKYSMSIDIYPTLLNFGGGLGGVQIDLDYADAANNISLTDTFVFTAGVAQKQTWHVKGVQGGPSTYGYAVKYFYTDGTTTQSAHVTQTSDAVFVPPPPPKPAPAASGSPAAGGAPAAAPAASGSTPGTSGG